MNKPDASLKNDITTTAEELAKKNKELQAEIVERKRVEEELRKLYRAIEQSSSTVVITNNWGIIEYVNPKFTQLTGYLPEEVIGKNPRILKPDNVSSEEFRQLWQTITAGREWRGEFCNRKKNGELYWEFASISAVKNSKGVINHFVAVKEDITERKRAEEERNKHVKELEDFMFYSTIMNDAATEDAVFKHMVLALRKYSDPDIVAAIMLDRERNMLYVPIIDPFIPVNELVRNEVIFDPSLCRVIKTGKECFIKDITKDVSCECIIHKNEQGGYLCIPLIAGGITFGIVMLIKKDFRCWDDVKTHRLISIYVGLTALALHRL